MKNIFKKIAVVALAMIMCVGAVVPAASASEPKCPGLANIHTSANCDYAVIAQTEASCEAAGTVTGKCTSCGTTFVVNSVEELGHDWDVAEVNCLAASTKTCKRCETVVEIPGTASGHDFGEWIVKGDEDCGKDKVRYRECSVCGYKVEETMKDEHSWVVAVYSAPVNCMVPGKATYVCENKGCDATKTATLWASDEEAAHYYEDWTVVVEDENGNEKVVNNPNLSKWIGSKSDPNAATLSCTKDGAHTQVCVHCGETKVIYTPASSYVHTLVDMKFTNATLDLKGCKGSYSKPLWTCYKCGIMFDDKTVTETADLKNFTGDVNGDGKNDAYDYVLVTYVAEKGDIAVAYTVDGYVELTTEQKKDYYVLCYEYQWKDVAWFEKNNPEIVFVEGDTFTEVEKAVTWWGYGHEKTTVYATCETAGYEDIHCTKCGTDSFKTLPALGHIFYPEVVAEDRVTIAKNLGIYKEVTNDQWTALGNVNVATGEKHNVWDVVYLPTCTENAKVVWCCLNINENKVLKTEKIDGVTKYVRWVDGEKVYVDWKAYEQCSETKEVYLSGARNAIYGHDLADEPMTPAVREATCTASGIYDYACTRAVEYYDFDANGKKVIRSVTELDATLAGTCEYTERVTKPALGHDWEEINHVENKQVTCKQDGVQWYGCSNCTETKKEEIASTGDEHAWKYLYESVEYPDADAVYDIVGADCDTAVDVYRYCGEAECKLAEIYEAYTLPAKGHDFVEFDEEARDLLKKVGDKLYVDPDAELSTDPASGNLAVAYIQGGECTKSAIYRLYCQSCSVSSNFEPDKDNVKESHNVQIASTIYNENGVYDADGDGSADDGGKTIVKLDCTASSRAYYWYCKDKNCAMYRTEDYTLMNSSNSVGDANGNKSLWVDKDGNPAELIQYTYYGTHLNPETGKVVTYKDVPDERISGAKTLEEARNVKAPVDENGNITAYCVEIPGTTLVWRYVAEVSCDNDEIEYGGFYCVKCDNTKDKDASSKPTLSVKAQVGDTRAAYHNLEKGITVPNNCVNYGYTEYSCKNCGETEQRNYIAKRKTHDIDYDAPVSVVKPTCESAGSRIYQCQYNDCRQLVTIVDAPLGHENINGDKLLTTCLDKNANIDNRRCKNCSQIIFSTHHYVDGRCKDCGAPKED